MSNSGKKTNTDQFDLITRAELKKEMLSFAQGAGQAVAKDISQRFNELASGLP
jgi:hypothetical protein